MENKDLQYATKLYLVHNQEKLKTLLSPFIQQKENLYKTQDIAFHKDIDEQFKELCIKILKDMVATNITAINPEDISIVFEDFILEEFLK